MAPTVASANGGDISAAKPPVTGRIATVYSEVQNSRLDHNLPLPAVIKNQFSVIDGPASSAAGNPGIHTYMMLCVYRFDLMC